MKLATLVKEKSLLKQALKNETINYYLYPRSNEELDIIFQFVASFSINSHFFELNLPESTQNNTLLNFTKSIGKSDHKVSCNFKTNFLLF